MRHAPSKEEIEDPKYRKLLGTRVLNDAFTEVVHTPARLSVPLPHAMSGCLPLCLFPREELKVPKAAGH